MGMMGLSSQVVDDSQGLRETDDARQIPGASTSKRNVFCDEKGLAAIAVGIPLTRSASSAQILRRLS
jgi:hypothetical protein